MIDRQSYLLGVEDVVLLVKDRLRRTQDPELRRLLSELIRELEEKKLWMAKQRIFGPY